MMESLCAIPPDYRYKVRYMTKGGPSLQRCVYGEKFCALTIDDTWARTEAQAWVNYLSNHLSQLMLDLYHEWRCRKDAAPGRWVSEEADDAV